MAGQEVCESRAGRKRDRAGNEAVTKVAARIRALRFVLRVRGWG